MKVTDSTLDRIQQRREKLERKGVIKEEIASSSIGLHLWHVDEHMFVVPSGEHEGKAIDVVVVPSGKFLPIPEKVMHDSGQLVDGLTPHLFETPVMWADACKNGLRLPDRRIRLIDAPPAPEFQPTAIERVPDATIATEVDPNAHQRPLAIRPEEIDRDAVLLDLEKFRKERGAGDAAPTSKPKSRARTFEEHARRVSEEMAAQFEAERLAQQKTETRPALSMAMAPTIKDWKGY